MLERPDAAADPALFAAALFAAVEVAPAVETKLRFAEQMVQVCHRLGDDRPAPHMNARHLPDILNPSRVDN